ncbi:hypothetical protein BD769DRAFT_1399684 [Suillus cothurnatus]|nr:hypothetical protein BD769DRAFT_1399684 [Suillus cothurnatus]
MHSPFPHALISSWPVVLLEGIFTCLEFLVVVCSSTPMNYDLSLCPIRHRPIQDAHAHAHQCAPPKSLVRITQETCASMRTTKVTRAHHSGDVRINAHHQRVNKRQARRMNMKLAAITASHPLQEDKNMIMRRNKLPTQATHQQNQADMRQGPDLGQRIIPDEDQDSQD